MTNSLKERSGVVYTKSWVVELILDLSGYKESRDLANKVAIEPAAGEAAFLIPMVDRLLKSAKKFKRPIAECKSAIQAFEVDELSAEIARRAVIEFLLAKDISKKQAEELARSWILAEDYLLQKKPRAADFVIGNPPYIRLEDLEPHLGEKYRTAYPTMVGRADIYIAFFEAALKQLNMDGVCTFICADRWMRNQYGSALRQFVTAGFSVETVIEMHNANAFESDVSAYPAITVIKKSKQSSVTVATLEPEAEGLGGRQLAELIKNTNGKKQPAGLEVVEVDSWFNGQEPWPCGSPKKLKLLKWLESKYEPLESKKTQTIVGIGVASGADKIFVTRDPDVVEESRLLPMAMAFDTNEGAMNWSGHYLVNPWTEDGLVDLKEFPRLAKYLQKNLEQLKGRHIAQKNPKSWYRTIDRVNHWLVPKKKLYVPDIRERLSPVLDDGRTYPHHNLYFVQSDGWDAEVLGGLLLSAVSQLFVECYGVKMRGGYLRFQAQYLRRIRVPNPKDITLQQAKALKSAFRTRDVQKATEIALEVYKIDEKTGELLGHQQPVP